jgi:hypothetical protein
MLAAVLLGAGAVAHADDPNPQGDPQDRVEEATKSTAQLQVRFSRFSNASESLHLVATVERHADNRALRVVIDSAGFYRSSQLQLDGLESPRLHELRWRSFPAGEYCVETIVVKAGGRSASLRRSFRGVGPATVTAPARLSSLGADLGPRSRVAFETGNSPRPSGGCSASSTPGSW